MPQILRTFISPDEIVAGRIVTYEELVERASTLNRAEALHFLGFLNLLLSLATIEMALSHKLDPVRDVQTWLIREVISADLLAQLKAKLGDAQLLFRPLLHRSQLLFVTRLVATWGRPDGGNLLATRDDFNVIGELLFLTNGLFRPDGPGASSNTALAIATEMGPLHETENPPTIDASWPRIHELLTQRLPAAAADPGELERLERVALFTTGFSLEAWLDLTFLLSSFWSAVSFKTLMADRSRAYLHPDAVSEVISKETLLQALVPLSTPFPALPDTLKIDAFSPAALYDLTHFRASPLWIMPNGAALCVDVALLIERLGAHAFWSMMNALDTADRRHQFSRTWGAGFEGYALDHLATIFQGKKWTFVRNPADEGSHEELWDAVAIRADAAIVIECKGTFIRSADKYSGRQRRFFRGLTQKFGRVKHGGVYQLWRGIRAVWIDGTATTAVPGLRAVKDVFPVLVVQDPIFRAGPVVRVLSDRFQRSAASRARTTGPHIWPLTVMTADALDQLSAAIAITHEPLQAILKTFHRTHPSRMISFDHFLSMSPARFNTAAVRTVLKNRFHAVADPAMQRFDRGVYGGVGKRPDTAQSPSP